MRDAIIGLCIGGLFLLVGSLMLLTDKNPGPGVSHDGILLEATGSKGPRGLHNNTTLRIERADGKIENHEIGSSLRVSDVAKIRRTANRHAGEPIVFYRERRNSGRFISAETVSGEKLVSAAHTRAVEQFTAWGIFLSGVAMGLIGMLMLPKTGKARRDRN
ncbi:MAG: hypothetical protein HRT80_04800 [Henriciella sp.]|nr:hypothetical protein [Henriciella sp.]